MEKKQKRNLELLHKAIEINPEDGYNYFQMGQSQFVLGNIDAAIEAYEKGMSLIDSTENLFVPEMIMSLAKVLTLAKLLRKDIHHLLISHCMIYLYNICIT